MLHGKFEFANDFYLESGAIFLKFIRCFFHAVITGFPMQLLQLFPCSYYSIFHAVITAFSMHLLQLFQCSYYSFFHAFLTAFSMQLLQLIHAVI
jgi:uncharacterized membrane protein